MPRLIFIALGVLLVWYLGWQLFRYLKGRQIDWTGITFAVGFVILAFYLRFVTDIG